MANRYHTFLLFIAGSLVVELVRRRLSSLSDILKGLILAQNERWRRGLGMQVEREVEIGSFGRRDQRKAANGVVIRRYVPLGLE